LNPLVTGFLSLFLSSRPAEKAVFRGSTGLERKPYKKITVRHFHENFLCTQRMPPFAPSNSLNFTLHTYLLLFLLLCLFVIFCYYFRTYLKSIFQITTSFCSSSKTSQQPKKLDASN